MNNEQIDENKTFFGQPIGLSTLFFTEMWERFSYYGMRAILVYYMYDAVAKGGLGLSKTTSVAIMSIYGSLVFMSSIVGGWIADRLIGAHRSVFYGGILIMFGHIVLAIPAGLTSLFISMILIILGTGLLKANVSGMVGHLYSKEDQRRDAGFSIFYMGINIGSLIAPIIVGILGQEVNYHLGFLIAAVGMFFGLIQYTVQGKNSLRTIGQKPTNPLTKKERNHILVIFLVIMVILAAFFGIISLLGKLTVDFFVNCVTILGVFLPIYYFWKMLHSDKVTSEEKQKVKAYIPLFIAAVVFWSLEEQGSSILALFAADRTQTTLFGITVPPSLYQTLNPLFIVVLTPVFVKIWNTLGARQPGSEVKFSMGLIFAGCSFLLLMFPGILFGVDHRVSPIWLILSFLIMILGELCLSPVGLSITTKLSPKAFESQTLAIWLLADAASQVINAQIARFYTPSTESAYFGIVGLVAVVAGIILFLLKRPIQRLIQHQH